MSTELYLMEGSLTGVNNHHDDGYARKRLCRCFGFACRSKRTEPRFRRE